MHRCRRLFSVAAILLVAPACGRSQAQVKLEAAQAESSKLQHENERLETVVRRTKESLNASRAEVSSLNSIVGDEKARLAAAEARLRAAADDTKKEKQANEELKRVTAHRDELKEWVEELLPLAEAQSPELVNLKAATEAMAREVADIRGLAWKEPVMRRRIRRAQVGEWMLRDLKKELPEEKARDTVLVGAEMGILPAGTDLYAIFASFLEAGAAAFYNPQTRTFYHIEGNDGRGAYPVVFHELVHAIEDQHFALEAFSRAVESDSDAGLARKGLVEGTASWFAEQYEKKHPEDAAAMMQSQMTPELMQKQLRMLQGSPVVLIATMALYPYKNGKAWIDAVTGGDKAKVAAVFADPPASTEQMLHPEKYKDPAHRDYPHVVAAPDLSAALPPSWRRMDPDTMGELSIGCLLVQMRTRGGLMGVAAVADPRTQGFGLKEPVKTAAEGWDGDRYAAAVDPATGRATVCWVSVWDSEQDAKEFAAGYAPLVGKKVTGEKPDGEATGLRFAETGTGRLSTIVREGARVVVVLGAPADRFDAVLAAGLATKVDADPRDPSDR